MQISLYLLRASFGTKIKVQNLFSNVIELIHSKVQTLQSVP